MSSLIWRCLLPSCVGSWEVGARGVVQAGSDGRTCVRRSSVDHEAMSVSACSFEVNGWRSRSRSMHVRVHAMLRGGIVDLRHPEPHGGALTTTHTLIILPPFSRASSNAAVGYTHSAQYGRHAVQSTQVTTDLQQSSESRLYTFSPETKAALRKFRLSTSRAKDPQAIICMIRPALRDLAGPS